MLRFALLLLVVINMGYFAWSHGWMRSLGWAPSNQSEPLRLQQQVRPEALVLPPVAKAPPVAATPAAAAPGSTAAPHNAAPVQPAPEVLAQAPLPTATPTATPTAAPTAPPAVAPEPPAAPPTTPPAPPPAPAGMCLQAGSFDEAQAKVLRDALRKQGVDSSQWDLLPTAVAGRWMVYIGKLQGAALEQRRSELRARNIDVDRAGGALEPGLSLGRYSSEEAATRALTQVLRQGVRGARVVQERPAATLYTLRLPNANTALRQQAQALQTALAGKPLQPCSNAE